MKKTVLVLLILSLLFLSACSSEQKIGGDKDDYGCLGAAGYTYDKDIGACTRDWELNKNQAKAAKIAVDHLGIAGKATINEVIVVRCMGCFSVDVKFHSTDKSIKVNLKDWKVVDLPV